MSHALSQSRSARQTQREQGFTTIELLVVVGILVVLAGIVFVGMKHLGPAAKGNTTKAALANLQGMLADLEASGGFRKQPGVWLWTTGTVIGRVSPGQANPTVTRDFWKSPSENGSGTFDALSSPGDISADGAGAADLQRNGSIAVVNTCLAMSMMSTLPDNRARLQGMQQNQLFVPEWRSGSITLPGADGFVSYQTDSAAALQYVPGMHVRLMGSQFVATSSYPSGNPQPVPNANASAPWMDETKSQNPAPLLVDGWNNPIIFVPATGLRVRLLNGKATLDPTDSTQNHIVVSPEGEIVSQNSATATVYRVGRPFFASAGADGDFSTGDDNIYSFEK